jgi:hypothetical protein
MVGPRDATVQVLGENNTTLEIDVDGSFVAGALAAMVAGFAEPAEDLLRKNLYGFTYVETYGDHSDTRNLSLGGANIIWFSDLGSSIYRIEEDITVDPMDTFSQINNMTQKQWVTRNLRKGLDTSLVGYLPLDSEDALGVIKGGIVESLKAYVAQGKISQYMNSDGIIRDIQFNADVIVEQDTVNKIIFNFMYVFYLCNVIKWLYGVYVVNTNDFGIGR